MSTRDGWRWLMRGRDRPVRHCTATDSASRSAIRSSSRPSWRRTSTVCSPERRRAPGRGSPRGRRGSRGPRPAPARPTRRGGSEVTRPSARFNGSLRNASPWSSFTGSHGTPASRRAASVASHDAPASAVTSSAGLSAPTTAQARSSWPSSSGAQGDPPVGQGVEAVARRRGPSARGRAARPSAASPPSWRKVSLLVRTPPPRSDPVTSWAAPVRSRW